MNIFSLSQVNELVAQLPPVQGRARSNERSNEVLRLPLPHWDPVRDAGHPEREHDAHPNEFIEFEVMEVRDLRGLIARRWVLRGLVAL